MKAWKIDRHHKTLALAALVAVSGTTAALVENTSSGAGADTTTATYSCLAPLVGAIDVQATTTTGWQSGPTLSSHVLPAVTVTQKLVFGVGLETLVPSGSVSVGGTFTLTGTFSTPDGTAPVPVPASFAPITVPTTGAPAVTATGTTAPVSVPGTGPLSGTVAASKATLTLVPSNGPGVPTPLAIADIPCTLEAGQTGVLAQFTTSPTPTATVSPTPTVAPITFTVTPTTISPGQPVTVSGVGCVVTAARPHPQVTISVLSDDAITLHTVTDINADGTWSQVMTLPTPSGIMGGDPNHVLMGAQCRDASEIPSTTNLTVTITIQRPPLTPTYSVVSTTINEGDSLQLIGKNCVVTADRPNPRVTVFVRADDYIVSHPVATINANGSWLDSFVPPTPSGIMGGDANHVYVGAVCHDALQLPPTITDTTITIIKKPVTTPFSFSVKGTTYVNHTMTTASLTGTFKGSSLDGVVTGDLSLANSALSFTVLGFLPATAALTFTPQGQTTGTFNTYGLTTTSNVVVGLPWITLFGLPIGGGASCKTATPATVTMTSSGVFGLHSGGQVTGSYTLPPLANCGFFSDALSGILTGPSNTLTVSLAPAA